MKYETFRIVTGLFIAVQPIVSGTVLPIGMIVSPIMRPEAAIAVCVVSWVWLSVLAVVVAVRLMREIESTQDPPTPPAIVEKRIIPVWNSGKRSQIEL